MSLLGRIAGAPGLVLAGFLVIAACARTPSAVITLDPTIRFQTIDGWQVYPRYWEHDKSNNRFDASFEPYADQASAFLVNEVGIDGARVEIWSGLENPVDHWSAFYEGRETYEENKRHRYEKINDNDDPYDADPDGFQFARFDYRFETMALPLIRAMAARGERLRINVNYVDFEEAEDGTLSHAKNPEEFAEFVLVFFERLRDRYGVVPDSFEIVLEPDNTRDWRGRHIGQALLAVERRLAANGFEPELIAPSAAGMMRAIPYFNDLVEVPGALEALDVLSYHRYGTQRSSEAAKIGRLANRHGLKTAMLEKVGAGIDELIEDLTLGHASSWQRWALAGRSGRNEDDPFYLTIDGDPAEPVIRMAEGVAQLSEVFQNVRRGAVRIEARSTHGGMRPLAFINPDGRLVTIVRARDEGGALTLAGLSPGTYRAAFTDDEGTRRELPDAELRADDSLRLEMPGPGVLTVVGR